VAEAVAAAPAFDAASKKQDELDGIDSAPRGAITFSSGLAYRISDVVRIRFQTLSKGNIAMLESAVAAESIGPVTLCIL
jgi:hypothetical protein